MFHVKHYKKISKRVTKKQNEFQTLNLVLFLSFVSEGNKENIT